ncbi:MAG: GntR family transcriptional regulator [Zoogloeaceae bacterium]|jgi:DNA-binding GntR family transcriptional regulator|nr:GntR family transcriptional regulator [Zoogloeaceae bacterium]
MDARRPPANPALSLAAPALYEQVAERLRNRIYAHELAPGSWVDEQAIAAEYGISRTPLREALKVLAAEGLVTLRPRRGCYVTELSEQDLDEIFPVMALLEGRCAYEAARKASDADRKRLADIHGALERHAAANDPDRFFEANQQFHEVLQELAGNRWLKELIQETRKFLKLTRRGSLKLTGRLRQSLAEHQTIMAAIERKNADLAGRTMHDHILSGRAALAKLYTVR